MARTRRRSKNRLMQEIDQGIQEYESYSREQAARRKHGRLIDLLLDSRRIEGIFYRPPQPPPASAGLAAGLRRLSRPTLWS